MKNLVVISFIVCAVFVRSRAVADPVFYAGWVPAPVTYTAAFEDLNYGSLLNYTEDNLIVSTPGSHINLPAVHVGPGFTGKNYYPRAGNLEYVSIRTSTQEQMTTLSMAMADGHYLKGDLNIYWETWRDGRLTGSGSETGLPRGYFYSIQDDQGISELRIAGYGNPTVGFGTRQSIGIDNLRVTVIPEPLSVMLMLAVLPVVMLRRNLSAGGDRKAGMLYFYLLRFCRSIYLWPAFRAPVRDRW